MVVGLDIISVIEDRNVIKRFFIDISLDNHS